MRPERGAPSSSGAVPGERRRRGVHGNPTAARIWGVTMDAEKADVSLNGKANSRWA